MLNLNLAYSYSMIRMRRYYSVPLFVISYTLLLVMLTILALHPLYDHASTRLLDQYDSLDSAWRLWWPAHQLAHDPLHLFDANIFYPYHQTMMFDELLFCETLLALPVYALGGTPLLAVNWTIGLNFVVAGWGMYLLAHHLSGSRVAGVVAGILYSFSAFHFLHIGHIGISNIGWLPLIFLALDKLMRGSRSWRWAGLLALFLTNQILSAPYLAYYAALLVGFYLCFALTQKDMRIVAFSRAFLGKLTLALCLTTLLTLPFILSYYQVHQTYSFKRPVNEIYSLSANLESLMAAPQSSPWLRQLTRPFQGHSGIDYERSLFPGFMPLCLLIIAIPFLRRWRYGGFMLVVALAGVVLSLGPYLMLDYRASLPGGSPESGIPLPYYLLYRLVPGFTAMHGVARIYVLTTFALALLGGWVVARVCHRLLTTGWRATPQPLVAALIPVAVISLALFEQLAPQHPVAIPSGNAIPRVYMWLRDQPPGAVLEFPFMPNAPGGYLVANYYQYFSIYHQHPILNGNFTGVMPSGIAALTRQLRDDFPSPQLLDEIRGLGIRYLVVHYDNLDYQQQVRFGRNGVGDQLAQVVSFDSEGGPKFSLALTNQAGGARIAAPLVLHGGDVVYKIMDASGSMPGMLKLVPVGSKVYIANSPHRSGETYMAVVGYMLANAGRHVYGYADLSFGQEIKPYNPDVKYDYFALYSDEDPTLYQCRLTPIWQSIGEHGAGIIIYRTTDSVAAPNA